MADKKISALVSLAGKDVAATDLFPVVDVSVSETKSLTRDELRNAVNAIQFAATKALATTAAASLPDGTIIEVAADESLSDARTRYKVAAGALVFAYGVASIYENGEFETVLFKAEDSATSFAVVDLDGWCATPPAAPSAPWAGRRFLVFGDSITETGAADSGNFGMNVRCNWPVFAYPMLSMSSLRNYAKSGASFREYGGQLDFQKISTQINESISNGESPEVIVLACGANDGAATLGDYATAMGRAALADLDRTKTIEAMRWAFSTIKTSYPSALCFAVTPIQRADVETSASQPLLDALFQMAKRYGFLVIDAHSESGIVKDFEAVGSAGRDLYDGLHPNARGQIKMARLISAKIKSAINY